MSITNKPFAYSFMANIYSSKLQFYITFVINTVFNNSIKNHKICFSNRYS